ncbi:MAG: PilZ domain-containing protein [Desulfurobacteriaceae bacterium]
MSLELIEQILKWLREVKDKRKSIEVVSFYNELPVRTKVSVIDIDPDRKVIQWSSNPRLSLAAGESKKLYLRFPKSFDDGDLFLGADVIYFNEDLVESTFPRPVVEPRFRREHLRVTTSEKLPVIADAKKDGEEGIVSFKVFDISEGGIGVLVNKGLFKLGEKLDLKLTFPNEREINTKGVVVNVKDLGKVDKVGIKFTSLSNRDLNVLGRYIMDRQREIMDKIRLLID